MPFPDLGELRKEDTKLLGEDRVLTDYEHLQDREHRVTDWEIQAALLDGVYEHHEEIEDRYVAKYMRKAERTILTVMFEVQDSEQGRYVFIATAVRPRKRKQ